MSQIEYQREMAAFDEKIALAKLEETKARERTAELKYQKQRFHAEITAAMAREQGKQNVPDSIQTDG